MNKRSKSYESLDSENDTEMHNKSKISRIMKYKTLELPNLQMYKIKDSEDENKLNNEIDSQ